MFLLTYNVIVYGQNVGDFRSLISGSWTSVASWQTYNGTSWVSAATYPGQNAGNYQVLINAGHNIAISTAGIVANPMGPLTINGTLTLNGLNSSITTFDLKTPQITITPGLTPYASINFINKCLLILPPDAILIVGPFGLQGDCSNLQEIRIGSSYSFANCVGAPGTIFTFAELMAAGGTINAVITPSATNICLGESVSLGGGYTGAIGNAPTYVWSSTGPAALTFTPNATSKNTVVTPVLSGVYTISLTVTTQRIGYSYTNVEKITLTVNKKSENPTSVTSGSDTVMLSQSTNLILSGGGGGTDEVIKWYAGSCGGTFVGTGNNLTVTPSATTTYYGRYENGSPCSYNTDCLSTTITVIPYANIWKGTLSTDFGTPGNWLDNKVPLSGENITFDPNPVNDCILDMDRVVGDITNPSVMLLVTDQFNLMIKGEVKLLYPEKIDATNSEGSVTLLGKMSQTLNATHYVNSSICNLNINNNVQVLLNGNLSVQNKLSLNSGSFIIGNNTLTLNDVLEINGGVLVGGITSNMVVGGFGYNLVLPTLLLNNLTLDRSNGLTLGGSLNLYGILNLNSGMLTLGPNELTFSGLSPIVLDGLMNATHVNSKLFFKNASLINLPNKLFSGSVNYLVIDGNGGLQLSEKISISNTLELINGKINTGSEKIVFENTANLIIGGSANSHINGNCEKIGNTAFIFAIGNSTSYAPIAISNAIGSKGNTDSFVASYHGFNSHPLYDSTQHENTISRISSMEYWSLTRTGTSNVNVTLSWDNARSGGIPLLNELLVIGWNGTQWMNYGNAATTGNVNTGTIRSLLISDFNVFTLGSVLGSLAILPISLLDFSADCIENKPVVKWTTSSEINNNYFEVEQSTNGKDWKSLKRVVGAGNSNEVNTYSVVGDFLSNSISYYRLKSVDFDEKVHFLEVISLMSCEGKLTKIDVYPNPSKGLVNVSYNGDISKIDRIEVFNLLGEKVIDCIGYQQNFNLIGFPEGVYYLVLSNNIDKLVKKFVLTN